MGNRGVGERPLRRGDVVALRSPREILETLDDAGSLDGLVFMPEMLGYFGRRFTVSTRVERACDTINYSGARRMPATVMLDDLRCDGGGHGGCQAGCRIYWKEAWLRRAGDSGSTELADDHSIDQLRAIAMKNSQREDVGGGSEVYRCQATDFLNASQRLGWWSVRSFFREVTTGNVTPWRFARVMSRLVVDEVGRRLRIVQSKPFKHAGGVNTREKPLGLNPGSRVRVRSAEEIAQTLDEGSRLRGLWFDREMVPYCGTSATVKARVERFVDETSGKMVELKSDCLILDGVTCKGYISDGRWFCCRGIYPWWREAWLEPEDQQG